MTQEDKELLLKDLCARLPYGVKVMKQFKSQVRTLKSIDVEDYRVYFVENDVNSPFGFDVENPLNFYQQIKPYLRPMSSMTEEEKREIYGWLVENDVEWFDFSKLSWLLVNWLNAHHFDYRGLIEKDLALVAPKNMYNNLK